MREKNTYAVIAATILNVIWWLMITLGGNCFQWMGDFVWILWMMVLFVISGMVQIVGYCVFQNRFQGNKLIYNLLFFLVMWIGSIVILILQFFLFDLIQYDIQGKMLDGDMYIFSLFALWVVYGYILLTRLLFLIGKSLVQCSKTSDRVLFLIMGAGIIVLMNLYTMNLGGVTTWADAVSTVFLKEQDINYGEMLEYAKNTEEREKEWKEWIMSKNSEGQSIQKEVEADASEGQYNEQECRRIQKMIKEVIGETWEADEVREWAALEWRKYDGEYYVVSMNYASSQDIRGKVDLSEFPHLKKVDFSRTGIEEVILPESIERLTEGGFRYCDELKKVTFGKAFKKLGREIFYWSGKLETIVFQGDAPQVPDWVTSWKNAKIYYPEGAKGWDSVKWKEYDTISVSQKK